MLRNANLIEFTVILTNKHSYLQSGSDRLADAHFEGSNIIIICETVRY